MTEQEENLEKYLAATTHCDHEDPLIRKTLEDILRDAKTPKEKALAIFYFVRDKIHFNIAYSHSKASAILRQGYGECLNKTNLQIAMLRAAGIPARFRMVKAKRESLHHLIEDFVYEKMPPILSHFYCECLLDDKWIACELLLDKPLYDGLLKAGYITKDQIPDIDWDGENDLIILGHWTTETLGTLASPEDVLAVLDTKEEGMLPYWLEAIIGPFFYRLNMRNTEKIRNMAEG